MLMHLCPKCKAMIPQGQQYCDKCQVIVNKKKAERKKISKAKADKKYNKFKRNTEHIKFYQSKEWKALRAVKLAQVGYVCQECKANGILTLAVDVHHIVPISEDWGKRLDINNLVCLCVECHNKAHSRWQSKNKSKKVNVGYDFNK